MITIVCFSVSAIFLTFLETNNKLRNGMKMGFILVTIISAIRYYYGNDYSSYLSIYDAILNNNLSIVALLDYFHDPGWTFINYCFTFFGENGFFLLIASISIIQNFIIYFFIKTFVPKSWWVLSVFIFLFCPNFYVLSMSMIRQSFCASLFLVAIPYIVKKRILPALIIVIIASAIHASSLFLIPLVFLGYLRISNTRFISLLFLFSFIFLMFSQPLLTRAFSAITQIQAFDNYAETYQNHDSTVHFGIGFCFTIIPYLVSIYCLFTNRIKENYQKVMIIFFLISFLIIPFEKIIQLVSRMTCYFELLTIATIPYTYRAINSSFVKILFIGIYVFLMLYAYWGFFHSKTYSPYFLSYHSLFSLPY